jgi:hypothetical protein
LNRDHIISAISDDFKDAHGFRPRGIWDFDSMSDSELHALTDRVYEEARLAYKEEEDRQAQSAKRFEELVLDTIRMGAGDRQTALKWLLAAQDDDWYPDDLSGTFCFEYDLPYSYKEELKAALNA